MIKFFQRLKNPQKAASAKKVLACGAIVLLVCGSSRADETGIDKSPLVGLKKSSIQREFSLAASGEVSANGLNKSANQKSLLELPPLTGLSLYDSDTTLKGVLKAQLSVSGTIRFLTIYRNMQESYEDMITSDKNISFLDYPLANVGVANTGGFPLLELNMQAKLSPNFNFNVGYSFGQTFTGSPDAEKARNLSSRQNLYFTGRLSTDVANFSLSAGGILWTSISRFTMGQPNYRDNYFERLPWDWYRNSFLRYEEYYTTNMNLGGEAAGRSAIQGFIGTVDFYKVGVKVSSVFGRSSLGVALANATTHFPAYLYAGRVEKSIFTRSLDGRIGLNFYTRTADTDRGARIKDMNQIYSLDGRMRVKKVIVKGEFGMGKVDNPAAGNVTGSGALFGVEFDKKVSSIPFGIEAYQIDYNMASFDGSILNTNTTVRNGGFINEYIYDAALLINVAQEVGMIANNRRGINMNGEANIGKLKIQLGMAMSQEIENRHDTITLQHRVNAFSRSRFRPWFQAGGPYGRIKSGWRKTFETFTITDDAVTAAGYKKGFNTLELLLKYKFSFLGKDVVALNFHAYNSIQDKFSPIPEFSDAAFVRLYFTDLTLAWKLGRKYSVVGYTGVEKVMGGQRIDLVDDNGQRINGADGKPAYDPNGKTVDQTGYAFGLGIDYDFAKTAGLHLRHTWMSHKDNNFTLDRFKGQETTFELKIFF